MDAAQVRTKVLAEGVEGVAGLLLQGGVVFGHGGKDAGQRLARVRTHLRLAVARQLSQRKHGLPPHLSLAVSGARSHNLHQAQEGDQIP